MRPIDITGQRFGRLTAIKPVGRAKSGLVLWLCHCECGNSHIVAACTLKQGRSRSCGCLVRDSARSRRNYHGLSYSSTMGSWGALITRCFNKNSRDYRRYGGRGITACEGIRTSITWLVKSIGERIPNTTVDRVDNSLGYFCGICPECLKLNRSKNIRWATPQQQGRNTSVNHVVEIDGEKLCITDWAERSGIKKVTILARINRGWSGDDLLLPPLIPGTRLS
jgi:hypothetical protein